MSKHRIIGLVVLLAVAVLITQYSLNTFKTSHRHFQVFRSPPIKTIDPKEITANNAPQIQPVETLLEKHLDNIQSAENIPSVSAWVVQVITISNPGSAKKILKQLKDLGFDGFISSMPLQGVVVYRVLVGPFVQHQVAVDALATIQQQLNMTGILKNYNVGDMPNETNF